MNKCRKTKRSHSLFFKLLLVFTLLGVGIMATFACSFKFLGTKPYKQIFHKNISNYISYIIEDIGFPVTQDKLIEVSKKTKVELIYNDLKSSSHLPDIGKIKFHKEEGGKYLFGHYKSTKYILFKDGVNTYALGIELSREHSFPILPLSIAGIISLFLFKLAYGAIRRMFLPLDKIKESAAEFAQGNFDHKIPVIGNGQLAELTQSINEMGNKIQDMLESKRELLLAIAHELRTPITRAKLHLELLDDSSRKNDISYEVEEMSTLVNDILESEKLKEGHKVLELEDVLVNQLIEEAISTYDQSNLSISLEECTYSLDKVRFTMAIKNIVNNALFYGDMDKGSVQINQTKNYIEIINFGKEIPKDEIVKLTDAFYRTDKSRTRIQDGGGVGLGLYLVERIIKAHGFDFKISSENGVTSFKILFS